MDGQKQFFQRQNMELVVRGDSCSVFKMENETGDGTATIYDIFHGVFFMFNDFHISECAPRNFGETQMFVIHHCREGRIEWEVGNGNYLYLAQGDFMIDSTSVQSHNCSFPTSHFHGATICFALDGLDEEVQNAFEIFGIPFSELVSRFGKRKHPFVMHGNDDFDHIISEIYHLPKESRVYYLRLKVIELLLFLKSLDLNKEDVDRPYFRKTQIDKVKAVHAFLTEHPETRYTTEQIAKRYDISVSALKDCFRQMYGSANYTYMKKYRLDMAASLLKESDLPVMEIAGKCGWNNASKFSEAFKKEMGMNPLEYRNHAEGASHI